MGLFERWLSVWVALAIAAGVALGSLFPTLFAGVAALEFAHVNLLVAVLIWVMIYPMMVQIDFAAVRDVGKRPRGLVLTLTINWLVKPFTMALLGWLFFRVLFADWVDPQSAGEYIAGMILLGVAPCTAMVFVWSQLTRGDPNYTLVQVSVNDLIMVFAFAPLVSLLLGVSDIQVPWATLLLSVLLYVVLPLADPSPAATPRAGPAEKSATAPQALVDTGAAGHRGTAVRPAGRHTAEPAADHRADCHSAAGADLRHLCARLSGRLEAAPATPDCSAGLHDQHLQFL